MSNYTDYTDDSAHWVLRLVRLAHPLNDITKFTVLDDAGLLLALAGQVNRSSYEPQGSAVLMRQLVTLLVPAR